MSDAFKGGRGKRAPYKTAMCRVPEPVKHLADELTAKYRELLEDYDNPDDPKLIEAVRNSISNLDEKVIISKSITSFISSEIESYGKNGAQKGKDFNMDTRKWDAFKNFMSKYF